MDHCPDHPDVELELGFGLAGGGYGAYLYCGECGRVIDKWQEEDEVMAEQRQDIGWAVKQMWNDNKVRRAGWNGKGMWLALQQPDDNSKMGLPYVYIKTVEGKLVPWLCSQTDLLAADWELAKD